MLLRQPRGDLSLVIVREFVWTLGATDQLAGYKTVQPVSEISHLLPVQTIDGLFQYIARALPGNRPQLVQLLRSSFIQPCIHPQDTFSKNRRLRQLTLSDSDIQSCIIA